MTKKEKDQHWAIEAAKRISELKEKLSIAESDRDDYHRYLEQSRDEAKQLRELNEKLAVELGRANREVKRQRARVDGLVGALAISQHQVRWWHENVAEGNIWDEEAETFKPRLEGDQLALAR